VAFTPLPPTLNPAMVPSMSDHIIIERDGPVAEVRLARPAKRNAITTAMYAALADALAGFNADAGVRAVLISAEGAHFTAGNDLHDFLANPPQGQASPVFRFLHGLAAFAKPVVAAVQGQAVGIGTTMLLHCDLVVLADDAHLKMPFVDLALVPEAASSLLIPRTIGHARAAEMLMLGDAIDAPTALAWGLANRVVPAGSERAAALALAHRLADKPPTALALTKRLLRDDAAGVPARMDREGVHFAEQLQTPELKTAIAAFFARKA
jgi:enoyl-CoA hydratase/carnithine racemase